MGIQKVELGERTRFDFCKDDERAEDERERTAQPSGIWEFWSQTEEGVTSIHRGAPSGVDALARPPARPRRRASIHTAARPAAGELQGQQGGVKGHRPQPRPAPARPGGPARGVPLAPLASAPALPSRPPATCARTGRPLWRKALHPGTESTTIGGSLLERRSAPPAGLGRDVLRSGVVLRLFL